MKRRSQPNNSGRAGKNQTHEGKQFEKQKDLTHDISDQGLLDIDDIELQKSIN
jgi:hypothetical protein